MWQKKSGLVRLIVSSYLSFHQEGLLSQFCGIVVVNCASSKELFESIIQVLQILKEDFKC